MNTAFIFPGQGSQVIGMGKDLFTNFSIAKDVFEQVNEVLGYNLSSIIFDGNQEELTLTSNAQLAIMATSMAFMQVILANSKKKFSELCAVSCGHSLGEYSALTAAGSMDLAACARLLKVRGTEMQNANPNIKGAMAACIGVNITVIQDILNKFKYNEICEIANDNIEGQVIISGDESSIDRTIAILKDNNYRAIKLNVSGAFHSSLMKPAEQAMQKALNETMIFKPSVPIIQNFTANLHDDPDIIKENLVKQICGRVRWRETLDLVKTMHIQHLIEVGPGKVLTNMAKKTSHNFNCVNISNVAELDDYLSKI